MKIKYNTTEEPLRIIKRKLKKYFNGTCLDLGADNGRHLYLMPKGSVGLDFYKDYFSEFQGKGYKGVHCDLNKGGMPFEDNEFDTVFFSHCLEHLEMPNKIIKEIYRVLKSHGKLIIGVPNVNCVHTDFYGKKWVFHINIYDGRVLKKLLQKNGFKVSKRYCNFPFGNWFSYVLFNLTPLKYIWDDIFYVCEK